MFGLTDPWIAMACAVCLGSTALCIIYAAWKCKKAD